MDGQSGSRALGAASDLVELLRLAQASTERLAQEVYGVSYESVPAVDASRPGDPVRTCLVAVPQGCPPGDDRGREYRTTNRRTGRSWTLPDAQHMCGGA